MQIRMKHLIVALLVLIGQTLSIATITAHDADHEHTPDDCSVCVMVHVSDEAVAKTDQVCLGARRFLHTRCYPLQALTGLWSCAASTMPAPPQTQQAPILFPNLFDFPAEPRLCPQFEF